MIALNIVEKLNIQNYWELDWKLNFQNLDQFQNLTAEFLLPSLSIFPSYLSAFVLKNKDLFLVQILELGEQNFLLFSQHKKMCLSVCNLKGAAR